MSVAGQKMIESARDALRIAAMSADDRISAGAFDGFILLCWRRGQDTLTISHQTGCSESAIYNRLAKLNDGTVRHKAEQSA